MSRLLRDAHEVNSLEDVRHDAVMDIDDLTPIERKVLESFQRDQPVQAHGKVRATMLAWLLNGGADAYPGEAGAPPVGAGRHRR
jgi:hypothetical protein